jgi:hypothetical protein
VIAYKFLRDGAVAPFTLFRWPQPGAGPAPWVDASPGVSDEGWIHACRVADLPYWLGTELWRVELGAPLVEAPHQIAAPRARLLERITAWNRALADELALDCALRARDLAAAATASAHRAELLSAHDAATLASVSGRLQATEGERAAYVNTAASAAANGAVAVSAFVVETLARWLGGDAEGDRERARQARWLADRLQLRG